MINNPNIGYRSSNARTIIRKYGTGWNEWKRGNFKPNSSIFGYMVTITYYDYLMPLYDRDRVETKIFYNRDIAIIFRNIAITNLIVGGADVISSVISLVRL